MPSLAEIKKLVLGLSISERADLATCLLRSLPAARKDADDGIAEALRRDAELDANPAFGLSREEFNRKLNERRK